MLIFIIGWPFYQYLAMLLIIMAFQLRIRHNVSSFRGPGMERFICPGIWAGMGFASRFFLAQLVL